MDILIDNPASPTVSRVSQIVAVITNTGFFLQRSQKIKDLTDLFINMHHLINEFRPHQVMLVMLIILILHTLNMTGTRDTEGYPGASEETTRRSDHSSTKVLPL